MVYQCPSVRFTCHALTKEPLGQFTSNFTELLELMVLRSVYFMVKFRIFITRVDSSNCRRFFVFRAVN